MRTILIRRFGLIALSMIFIMSMTGCNDEATESPPHPIGRCGEYVQYQGAATILSVELTNRSGPPSPACYHGYKVLFALSDDISHLCSEDLGYFNNNVWTFTLANGWAPGPEYLDKYNIDVGAVFACVLSVQRSGPCTPCIIEFEGLNQADYFECNRDVSFPGSARLP